VKRKEAVAIYRAGQEPVVDKLCELSAKIDEQAKKIASLENWTLDKDGEIQVINNILVYLNNEYSPDIQKIS